jgi:hypothetical protein
MKKKSTPMSAAVTPYARRNTLLVFISSSTFRLSVRLRVVIDREEVMLTSYPRHFRTNFTLAVHCSLPRRRLTKQFICHHDLLAISCGAPERIVVSFS